MKRPITALARPVDMRLTLFQGEGGDANQLLKRFDAWLAWKSDLPGGLAASRRPRARFIVAQHRNHRVQGGLSD
jgi:hypothetical protein